MPSPAEMKRFDASEHFQLIDISLWETSLKRHLDYLPAQHEDHIAVLTRDGIRAEIVEGETREGETSEFLRAFVTMGTRGVFEPADKPVDVELGDDESVIFEIDATFLVLYGVKKRPDSAELERFVRLNCVHNAWPFWRQHVFDTLKRASLPMVPVPFFQMRNDEKLSSIDEPAQGVP